MIKKRKPEDETIDNENNGDNIYFNKELSVVGFYLSQENSSTLNFQKTYCQLSDRESDDILRRVKIVSHKRSLTKLIR